MGTFQALFKWDQSIIAGAKLFTGIVEEVGRIKSVAAGKLQISARKVLEGAQLGDSVAVSGICLTVIALANDAFSVEVMPETLRRTNLGALRVGDGVNLERALEIGGRLGGHFVQGHVDGTGKIISFRPESEAIIMKISAPPEIMRYVVEKGFIAIEGISLTIVACDAASFSVSLVTYTRQNTSLNAKQEGDPVNLEVDILAKYVEKFTGGSQSRMTVEFLAEHGFA